MQNLWKMAVIAIFMMSGSAHATGLKIVEAKYVCMVNDQVFDREQIAVPVGDQTYYGCCAMCKKTLTENSKIRSAVDPVTNEKVDKATAIIGAGTDGQVYYFATQNSFDEFSTSR